MIFRNTPLAPGLYLVSTPIGNARDITLRALDTLASADILVAEDTRTARKLLEIHGVDLGKRSLWSYHDHSGEGDRSRIVAALNEGRSVAYVSEAGTPLVADPGYKLARDVIDAELAVHAVPGASAVLAALAVGGLGTDRFHFAGFLPTTRVARRQSLLELAEIDATLVFYEAGRRVSELLCDLCETLGEERPAAICRELTKAFETVERGSLADLEGLGSGRETRGEFVILVGRSETPRQGPGDVDEALRAALSTMRVKDAATAVAGALGLNRRTVYQRALELGRQNEKKGKG